jgi:diguanylate cyclase (GGDEF)-like protein
MDRIDAPAGMALGFAAASAPWLAVLCVAAVGVALALYWRQRSVDRLLRQRLESAAAQLASARSRDSLTGLVTREDLEAALEEAAQRADHRNGPSLAVLCIGLDDFRTVNHGWGHRAGDAVLVEAANRLSRLVGDRPWVSRIGGDEFALLIEGDGALATAAAERALGALQTPFETEGLQLSLSASAGVALYPDHGAWSKLVAHAALAMRSVKLGGGGGHAMYEPALAVDLRDQAELLQDLRRAVERRELQLLYQPKVDARSLQVTAAEALLRWVHPRRGVVSPALFVPLAERHGLMKAIGDWVITEACRQAAAWRERGLRMRIAINISSQQLRQDDLVSRIEAELARHAIPAARLTCEITESLAMEDTAQTRAAFERLREAGFHVSIDDFGTGHSSLAVLRRLPAAELKIDRAFVTDLGRDDSRACSIVEAVVRIARTLGLRVVAEGVETEAQRDILVRLGCDELQGYLFAKPMSAAALALWADADDGPETAMFRASLFQMTHPAPLDPVKDGLPVTPPVR